MVFDVSLDYLVIAFAKSEVVGQSSSQSRSRRRRRLRSLKSISDGKEGSSIESRLVLQEDEMRNEDLDRLEELAER